MTQPPEDPSTPDELDWTPERDGRMREYATDDGEVITEPYRPDGD